MGAPDPKPRHWHIAIPAGIAILAVTVVVHFANPYNGDPERRTAWPTHDTTPTPDPPEPVEPATDSAARDLTPAEEAFMQALNDRAPGAGDLETGRSACGLDGGDPPTANDVIDAAALDEDAELLELAIRHLCPKYLPALKKGKLGFADGTFEVGKDIKPGAYRTNTRITDCYWERSTGSGDIIKNAFITNAPRGVKVTVYQGEGFTSEGCGNWMPA